MEGGLQVKPPSPHKSCLQALAPAPLHTQEFPPGPGEGRALPLKFLSKAPGT